MISNNAQTVGWDENGRKVTGRHGVECRERGAVGPLFDEYEMYEGGKWWTVLHPLDANGIFRVRHWKG